MAFSHEKLIVYQKSIKFNRSTYKLIKKRKIKGDLRDQVSRASHNIALNIAEGNGKFYNRDRANFLRRASGSATERAGCLDLMVTEDKISNEEAIREKVILEEIVRILTRMSKNLTSGAVKEEGEGYGNEQDLSSLEPELWKDEEKD